MTNGWEPPPPEKRKPPQYWRDRAFKVAQEYGVDPYGFVRLINRESSFSTENTYGPGTSTAGAMGIAQFMPDTATGQGINPWDPEEALRGAAKYILQIGATLNTTDWRKLALGYTHGEGGALSLFDQWGEDWFAHVKPDYQDYIEYVAQGPGTERALTPTITRPRLIAGLPYGTDVASLTSMQPGDPFAEVPEYFTGYRQIVRNSFESINLLSKELDRSFAFMQGSYVKSVGDPKNPGTPSKHDLEIFLFGKGYSKDQVDLILAGSWTGPSGSPIREFARIKKWAPTLTSDELRSTILKFGLLGQPIIPSPATVIRDYKKEWKVAAELAAREHGRVVDELQRQQNLSFIIQWLPVGMTTGEVSSVQDVEDYFKARIFRGATAGPLVGSVQDAMARMATFTLNQQDKEFVSDLMQKLSPALDLQPDASIDQVMEAMTDRNRPTPAVLSSLTADQIQRYLTGAGAPMEPPLGLTQEDLRDVLRGVEMSDSEYQDAVSSARAAGERLSTDWYNSFLTTAIYRAGISVPEIPKLSTMQRLKMFVIQPALAAAEFFDLYAKKWSMPIAASDVMVISRLGQYLGFPPIRGVDKLQRVYEQNRAAGRGHWDSLQRAWEDWDAPGAVELAIELLGDPVTYFGLGIATKATKAIPVLGPIVKAAETGWVKLWDLPFAGLRAGWKALPKTIEQTAAKAAVDLGVEFNEAFATRLGRQAGLRGAQTVEMRGVMEESIREFVTGPGGPGGRLWRVGQMTLQRFKKVIGEDEITKWARRLGGVNAITKQVVQDVNFVYEGLMGTGVHGRITTKEAAPRLLQILGAEDTSEGLNLASRLISSKLTRDTDAILRIFTGEPKAAMQNFVDTIRNTFISNAKSEAWKFSERSGMSMALASYSTNVLGWKPLVMLDQIAVRPMANLYLLFVGYGPYNWLETGFRSMRTGVGWVGGLGKRNRSAAEEAMEHWGYLRVPEDVKQAALGAGRMEVAIVPGKGESVYGAWAGKGIIPLVTRELPLHDIPLLKKIPRMFWSFQNFNNAFSRIGSQQRAVALHRMMLQEMGNLAPKEMRFISDTIGSIHDAGLSMSGGELDELSSRLVPAAIHSPESVRALKLTPEAMRARRYVNDVAVAVEKTQELEQPFQNYILQKASRGELAGQVDEVVEATFASVQDHYLSKLPARAEMLRRWAEEVTGDMVLTREGTIRNLGDAAWANDAIDDIISDHYAITTERAHQLKAVGGDALHSQAYDDMMEFYDEVGVSMTKAHDSLQARITQIADGDERKHLFSMLENLQEQHRLTLNTRRGVREITERHLEARPGRVNWDARNAEVEDLWASTNTRLDELKTEWLAASMAAPGAVPTGTIDQVFGELAPANVARLFAVMGDDISRNLVRVETMTLMSRRKFTGVVRRKADVLARAAGRTADEMGFTRESIERVYDQLLAKLRIDPRMARTMEPIKMSLEGLRSDLHAITQKGMLPAAESAKWNDYLEGVASELDNSPMFRAKEATPEWAATREKAMDQARTRFELDFTDYSNDNMFDAMMRRLMPFWTYESQRWPYLARAAIQTPGVFTTWGKYMDHSDTGYVHIPSTDLEINPFRGTIFMGGLRRFYVRDYPEYADKFQPWASFFDYASKAGFYPGFQFTLPIAAFGGEKPQYGELLPQFARTGIGALVGLGIPGAKRLQETFFPERFRDYQTILTIGKIADQRNLDIDVRYIWDKKVNDVDLTPQEQQLWDEASRHVGRMSVLFEQTGLFRMRPEELIEAWKALAELYEELTGVSVEQQEVIRNREPVTGERFSDLFPLDPLDQERINELESMKYWVGLTAPLLPSEYQKVSAKIGEYWHTVEGIWTKARQEGFTKDDGTELPSTQQLHVRFVNGEMSASDYSRFMGDVISEAVVQVRGLKQSEIFKDVPATLDERVAFALEHNLPQPTFHPGQELLWEYYQMSPKLRTDEEGNLYYDFATYFAQVDALLESMPDAIKTRFLDYIHRDWTPTQKLYWESSREYLRPYTNLREAVIQQFSPEEQSILRTYTHAEGFELDQLRDVKTGTGDKLISTFETMLRDARINLRMMDPQTDAWLAFWGRTSTFRTKNAKLMYADLLAQYRPGVAAEVLGIEAQAAE